MERLKVNGAEYEIERIQKRGNLMTIDFVTDKAPASDKAELYTSGGELAAVFENFNTVYKDEGKKVTYSNDGTVYTEPEVVLNPELAELTDEQKAEIAYQQKLRELESQIADVDAEFKTLDYIGIKIATGRAAIEEYTSEIERMTELADRKNELETELQELKGSK